MKIVKGDDGKDYVEFSGIVMMPTGRELDGTATVTMRPPSDGAPADYRLVRGSLPPGMSLDPTAGVITGKPTSPGLFEATVRVSTATGFEDRKIAFGAPQRAIGASPSVSEMQDRLSSQVSLDVDRVMTTGSDEPVATFTAEGEQKELQEWSRANPSMGMSVPGTVMPEWLGALMIPGAIIGQLPPSSQGYALDGLARMRNGFDRSGWDSRGISFATIMDEAPKMKAELWMPDDEPAPPPPVRGRFQNLDLEEMP